MYVLFPSLYDNFGLVKVEAAAYSTAGLFIENSCAGYGVTDGVNGFLIHPKDVDALTEKLDLLLSNKELREKMGKAARKYAEENFDIDIVIQRHLEIYNELL